MTSEMEDRVAEAIRCFAATWIHDDFAGLFAKNGIAPVQGMARAAIAAMREPTEAMVRTGVDLAMKTSLGGHYHWPDHIRNKHRAMIEPALAETPAHV